MFSSPAFYHIEPLSGVANEKSLARPARMSGEGWVRGANSRQAEQ